MNFNFMIPFSIFLVTFNLVTCEKKPLRLALFYEKEPRHHDYRCIISAQQLATSYINNSTEILPDHHIEFDVYGEMQSFPHQIDVGSTAKAWFDMLQQGHVTQGIIGPSNSRAMLGLHEMNIDQWVPMIGYGAKSTSIFPKELDIRVNPTNRYTIKILLSFFKLMGWRRFGILYYHGLLASQKTVSLRDDLVDELQKMNAKKIVSEKFTVNKEESLKQPFINFKKEDIRIIVMLTDADEAYDVFCEAYMQQMNSTDYVYIMMGQVPRFGRVPSRRCNGKDVVATADGAFSFRYLHLRRDAGLVGASGKTASEIRQETRQRKKEISGNSFCSEPVHNSAFDAIYNMAFAYHSLLYKDGRKIRDGIIKDYGDWKMSKIAAQSFTNVSFEGVTGQVKYDSNNDRIAEHAVFRLNASKSRKRNQIVAYSDGIDFKFVDNTIDKFSLFEGGEIPIDGYILKSVAIEYNSSMKYFIWAVSVVLIFYSLIILAINIIFRERSLIKMSSPNINNIILIGSILCYITIIIHGLVDHCNEEAVLFAVGFTLLFGGLFCKTWRVYRIFTAVESLKTIAIKDTQLYIMVFFFTAVDAILCTIWLIFSPYHVENIEVSRQILPDNRTELVEVYQSCVSEHQTKFEVTMFIYKGLLMIFGLFLAWETRKVEIPALNDSKQIGLSIYTVVLIGTLGAICCYSLTGVEFMDARYAILMLSIVVSTIATILFLFLPKFIVLFGKDRTREKQQIRSRYLSEDSINTQSTTDSRSRTVSRKEIPDIGNLFVVHEDQAATTGSRSVNETERTSSLCSIGDVRKKSVSINDRPEHMHFTSKSAPEISRITEDND